jgi:hypothetical protein
MAAAGCGGGDDDGRRSTTTESTTPESTAPPTTSAEEGVEADYLAAVAALARVTTTTVDPNDPGLAAHYVDPALSAVRTQVATWQAEGKIWVTGDASSHIVTQPITYGSDGSALVTACDVSNDALVAVGATDIEFPSPSSVKSTTTLIRRDGTWVVQTFVVAGTWDGRQCEE